MYFVYLLKKLESGKTYIGSTNDLRRRLREHKNKIRARILRARPSTKEFCALEPDLIYYESFKDERDAREREKKLKQRGQTMRRLKEKLKYSLR